MVSFLVIGSVTAMTSSIFAHSSVVASIRLDNARNIQHVIDKRLTGSLEARLSVILILEPGKRLRTFRKLSYQQPHGGC